MQHTNQVGGWWNLTLGKMLQNHDSNWLSKLGVKQLWAEKSSSGSPGPRSEIDVEDMINALAETLGLPPKILASAIAGGVREYMSLSSMPSAATTMSGRSSETLSTDFG